MLRRERRIEHGGGRACRGWGPRQRDGAASLTDWAWVAKVIGMLRLDGWPEGMRVIICRERTHPFPAAGHSHRRARVYVFGTERLAVHRLDGRAPSPRAARGQHPVRQGTPACATSQRTDTTNTIRSNRGPAVV